MVKSFHTFIHVKGLVYYVLNKSMKETQSGIIKRYKSKVHSGEYCGCNVRAVGACPPAQ